MVINEVKYKEDMKNMQLALDNLNTEYGDMLSNYLFNEITKNKVLEKSLRKNTKESEKALQSIFKKKTNEDEKIVSKLSADYSASFQKKMRTKYNVDMRNLKNEEVATLKRQREEEIRIKETKKNSTGARIGKSALGLMGKAVLAPVKLGGHVAGTVMQALLGSSPAGQLALLMGKMVKDSGAMRGIGGALGGLGSSVVKGIGGIPQALSQRKYEKSIETAMKNQPKEQAQQEDISEVKNTELANVIESMTPTKQEIVADKIVADSLEVKEIKDKGSDTIDKMIEEFNGISNETNSNMLDISKSNSEDINKMIEEFNGISQKTNEEIKALTTNINKEQQNNKDAKKKEKTEKKDNKKITPAGAGIIVGLTGLLLFIFLPALKKWFENSAFGKGLGKAIEGIKDFISGFKFDPKTMMMNILEDLGLKIKDIFQDIGANLIANLKDALPLGDGGGAVLAKRDAEKEKQKAVQAQKRLEQLEAEYTSKDKKTNDDNAFYYKEKQRLEEEKKLAETRSKMFDDTAKELKGSKITVEQYQEMLKQAELGHTSISEDMKAKAQEEAKQRQAGLVQFGKDLSTGLSGLSTTGFASGGYLSKGKSYLVGENGAEMFEPSTDGKITPNYQLKNSNDLVNNINRSSSPTVNNTTSTNIDRGLMKDMLNALNKIANDKPSSGNSVSEQTNNNVSANKITYDPMSEILKYVLVTGA